MLQYARENGNKTVFNYTQNVRTYTVKHQVASQPRPQALVSTLHAGRRDPGECRSQSSQILGASL